MSGAVEGQWLYSILIFDGFSRAIVGAGGCERQNFSRVLQVFRHALTQWGEKHRAIQLNHLVGVKSTVSKEAADEVYRLLLESKKAAGDPPMLPHGLEANRRNLEVAIDYVYRQRLIPRRFAVDELFDDLTRGLGA